MPSFGLHGVVRHFAVAGAVMLMPLAAGAQEKVGGTVVTMTPPPGYTAATGFAGFANEATGGSIMVAELPAEAHAQLATMFGDLDVAKTGFAMQGVTVERVEKVTTAVGAEVPVLVGKQAANGVTFDKWIALFGGNRTVLLTAQSPQGAGTADEVVLGAIRSVSLGQEASLEEKLAALPLAITAVEPFRVIDTIGGSGVLMTAGEGNVDPSGLSPIIIAVYQLSAPLQDGQAEQAAETLLRGTRGYDTAEIDGREIVDFAGEDGVLLTGNTRAPGGEVIRFAQYLAVSSDGRFIRLIAQATPDDFTLLDGAISQIADSISFK